MPNKKIKTQKDILNIIAKARRMGKKIVTLNGSFDVLHAGHISSLEEASGLGNIFILLLNSDKSIRSYKGRNRPIICEQERAKILSAIEFIDYIVIFDEINPKKILNFIKPDIHCNGSDWGKNCIEREVVEKNGGKIHILNWQKGRSSTDIIKKILSSNFKPDARAIFLDRDGVINKNKFGYIYKIKDFEFLPGAIKALIKISQIDYKIFITTNQSGIGRGYYSEKEFKELNQWLEKQLKKEGIYIERIYHCPHHPDDKCECRKPNIKMIMEAAEDYNISLNHSWVIGDEEKDVLMGREVNAKTIKIGKKILNSYIQPNYYAKDLLKAINLIIDYERQ